MEVVNLGKVRHFLREKPIRVNLFDRPRLFSEVICLEPEQQETRHSHSLSDAFYLVVEGNAHLRAGTQARDLEEQDLVMVPPGVEHSVQNPGPGRLTVLAMIAPKPTRASEVQMPRMRWTPPIDGTIEGHAPAREGGEEARPAYGRPRGAAPRPSYSGDRRSSPRRFEEREPRGERKPRSGPPAGGRGGSRPTFRNDPRPSAPRRNERGTPEGHGQPRSGPPRPATARGTSPGGRSGPRGAGGGRPPARGGSGRDRDRRGGEDRSASPRSWAPKGQSGSRPGGARGPYDRGPRPGSAPRGTTRPPAGRPARQGSGRSEPRTSTRRPKP